LPSMGIIEGVQKRNLGTEAIWRAELEVRIRLPPAGSPVQTVPAAGGRPQTPPRGRRAASAPRISPGHWDDRRMFPQSGLTTVPWHRRTARPTAPAASATRWRFSTTLRSIGRSRPYRPASALDARLDTRRLITPTK